LGIWSTAECVDKAKEIGAQGLVYYLGSGSTDKASKGICLTFTTTDFISGPNPDFDTSIWAYGCM